MITPQPETMGSAVTAALGVKQSDSDYGTCTDVLLFSLISSLRSTRFCPWTPAGRVLG